MDKHGLPVISVLLLLVSLLTAWYNDHLVNRLFLFAIPVYLVLGICYVVLMLKSIGKCKKEKSWSGWFSMLVLVLLFALIAIFPFREAKVKYEVERFETDRLEIVRMIKDGRLRPKDQFGNVDLPAGFERLSSDGEVFIDQNDEDGQVISFWVFRGMLSGSAELICSSGGEELIRENESGHPITKVERLKDNWYYVLTDY